METETSFNSPPKYVCNPLPTSRKDEMQNKMAKTKIPIEVQETANKIIADFNKAKFKKNENLEYFAKYKGEFLYINRQEQDFDSPICRLKYKGNNENWEFAIYKHSSNSYDANEWMFPGVQHANGTIEGALKAGHEAYPPSWTPSQTDVKNLFEMILKSKVFRK